MTPRVLLSLIAVTALAGAGCQSSSSQGCSFSKPATLAASSWPKFRHDIQNTGHVDGITVAPAGTTQWVFPPLTEAPKGAFAASPSLNGNGTADAPTTELYIGSTDGQLYGVLIADGTEDTSFVVQTSYSITSSALIGYRDLNEGPTQTVYVGTGLGQVYALQPNGDSVGDRWPSSLSGYLGASPNLNPTDGAFYIGGLVGDIYSLCPNGYLRFAYTSAPVQSSPAVAPDGTMYIGADDRQLRAFYEKGPVLWSFAASAPILASPVVELANGSPSAIYVADTGGLMFKVDPNGLPVAAFDFLAQNGAPVGPIRSSPALANGRVYVGSDDGHLYAIDATTGAIVWSYETDGSIVSSPAVATGTNGPVVVVGSDDGNVYALRDDGATPTAIMTFEIGAPVRSSPAIGSDGTIYVGADDGRVYAIE